MGNEQSSELSPEQREAEAQLRARIRAETAADLDLRKERAKQKILEERRQAALKEPDIAASSANATGTVNESFQTKEVNKNHHVASEVTIRSLEPSQEEGEIVETPEPTQTSEDILQEFNPRKQPRDKDSKISTSSAKRPAISQSAFSDERRPTISGLPKIAKRTSVASPQSPDRSHVDKRDSARTEDQPPRWYQNLKEKKSRDRNDSNADTILTSLRTQISRAQASAYGSRTSQDILDSVRTKLHTIIFVEVNEQLLKRNRMLTNDLGLPQIFNDRYSKGVKWPFDIKADARELYNKWSRRDFGTDLLRGIQFEVKSAGEMRGEKATDSIDPMYQGKISAKYHGNGDLLNGQWWPTQLTALRDGAHGVSQGGISGEPGDGAYSIIMSGGHAYADEDYGDEVRYCGTDSDNGAITDYTRRMIESINNHPVRVIRSHNLDSPYAPKLGFRYDGLYQVTSYKNVDGPNSMRQRHIFKLVRCEGQDPIRGGDGPETRPTKQEIKQYQDHKRFAGKQ